jgi:hypothetical protein
MKMKEVMKVVGEVTMMIEMRIMIVDHQMDKLVDHKLGDHQMDKQVDHKRGDHRMDKQVLELKPIQELGEMSMSTIQP